MTTLPPASSIVTTGWVVSGVPSRTEPAGSWVKTSWAAGPTATVSDRAAVRLGFATSVACRV